MKLFAQITKVDEEKRLVFGRAADETPDKSGEMLNYDGSKPHFQKWSEDISKDTDGKSLGNVRAMHGKVAAGKLTDIQFDDTGKSIDVCAKIVDSNEWNKVMEGVYTGFSIGGAYGAKTVEKVDDKDITRYIAIPSEISLVDRPCIPTAKFFQVQKADGTTQEVAFAAAEEEVVIEKTEDVEVTGTPDEIIAFGKLMNDKGLTMAEVISLVKGDMSCPDGCDQAEWDAMTAEEKAAYGAEPDADDTAKVEIAAAEEALAKLEAALADPLVKIGARNSATDKSRINAIHEAAVSLGADCETAKVEPDADLQKADNETLTKLIADAVAPLKKALDEAQSKITKLEEQPAPARVSLRAVSKADDTLEKTQPTEADLVKDGEGQIHPGASLIKQLHQTGGQPMVFHG